MSRIDFRRRGQRYDLLYDIDEVESADDAVAAAVESHLGANALVDLDGNLYNDAGEGLSANALFYNSGQAGRMSAAAAGLAHGRMGVAGRLGAPEGQSAAAMAAAAAAARARSGRVGTGFGSAASLTAAAAAQRNANRNNGNRNGEPQDSAAGLIGGAGAGYLGGSRAQRDSSQDGAAGRIGAGTIGFRARKNDDYDKEASKLIATERMRQQQERNKRDFPLYKAITEVMSEEDEHGNMRVPDYLNIGKAFAVFKETDTPEGQDMRAKVFAKLFKRQKMRNPEETERRKAEFIAEEEAAFQRAMQTDEGEAAYFDNENGLPSRIRAADDDILKAAIRLQAQWRGQQGRKVVKMIKENQLDEVQLDAQREELVDDLMGQDEDLDLQSQKKPRILNRKQYAREVDFQPPISVKNIPKLHDKWITTIGGYSTVAPGAGFGDFDYMDQDEITGVPIIHFEDRDGTNKAFHALQQQVNAALSQNDLKKGEIRTAFAKVSKPSFEKTKITTKNANGVEETKEIEVPKMVVESHVMIIQTAKGVSQVFTEPQHDIVSELYKKKKDFYEDPAHPERKKELYEKAFEACKTMPYATPAEKKAKEDAVRRVARAIVRGDLNDELQAEIKVATDQSRANSLGKNEYAEIVKNDKSKRGRMYSATKLLNTVDPAISVRPGVSFSNSKTGNAVKIAFNGPAGEAPKEAYAYIAETPGCYIRVQVATKDNQKIGYWDKRGNWKAKTCKAGEIVFDECISKDNDRGGYTQIPVYGRMYGYSKQFEAAFGVRASGIESMYRDMVIEATSSITTPEGLQVRGVGIKHQGRPGKEYSAMLPNAVAKSHDNKQVLFNKKIGATKWDPEEIFLKHPQDATMLVKMRIADKDGSFTLNDGSITVVKKGETFIEPLPYYNTDPINPQPITPKQVLRLRGVGGEQFLAEIPKLKVVATIVDEVKEEERKLRHAAAVGDEEEVKRILALRDDIAAEIIAQAQRDGKFQTIDDNVAELDSQIIRVEQEIQDQIARSFDGEASEGTLGELDLLKQNRTNWDVVKREKLSRELQKGINIDVNSRDSTGRTALVLAIEGKHGKVVKTPAAAGAPAKTEVKGVIGELLKAKDLDISAGYTAKRYLGFFAKIRNAIANKHALNVHRNQDMRGKLDVARDDIQVSPEEELEKWADGGDVTEALQEKIGGQAQKEAKRKGYEAAKEEAHKHRIAMEAKREQLKQMRTELLKAATPWQRFTSNEQLDAVSKAARDALDAKKSARKSEKLLEKQVAKFDDRVIRDQVRAGSGAPKFPENMFRAIGDAIITDPEAKADRRVMKAEKKAERYKQAIREDVQDLTKALVKRPSSKPSRPQAIAVQNVLAGLQQD